MFNTDGSPLRLPTSKPKTLIKDCSSDTHLEVNCHILIIIFADHDKRKQQLLAACLDLPLILNQSGKSFSLSDFQLLLFF